MEPHDAPRSAPDLFGSLLAALLRSPPGGAANAALVGHQPPLAVLELPGEQAGIVLLDARAASASETAERAARVTGAHQGGVLTLVVVGGGAELEPGLQAAQKASRDLRALSLYHLDDGRQLRHVGGRRTSAVQKAAAAVATTPPLSADEVTALIARGQREREEAIHFAAELSRRKPRVTYVLIAACVGLYALGMYWKGDTSTTLAMVRMGANMRAAVIEGEVWRLLSSAFLHSFSDRGTHLVMNMFGLWSFGSFLEPVLRWRRFTVLYAVSALVGSLGSAFVGGTELSVGASGALWGLMLAGFALSQSKRTVLPGRMASQLNQRLLVLLAINVALTFMVPNIDIYAHLGGGLTGFILVGSGLLAPRSLSGVDDERPWLRIAAPLAAFLMAASVAAALLRGRPWVEMVLGI